PLFELRVYELLGLVLVKLALQVLVLSALLSLRDHLVSGLKSLLLVLRPGVHTVPCVHPHAHQLRLELLDALGEFAWLTYRVWHYIIEYSELCKRRVYFSGQEETPPG